MLFSIATPVVNGMPGLRGCVGSVRRQAEQAASITVEHILQDGGSTDGGLDFLKNYTRTIAEGEGTCTPNYAVQVESGQDEGMYDAINKAWGRAEGDILAWLNADEQYLPGTLAKVAAYFDAHPQVDAVFGDIIIVDRHGNAVAARREIPLSALYVANTFLYAASCATFYRRRLWDEGVLRLDKQYRYAADMDMVLRALKAGVNYGQIDDYLSLFAVERGRNLSFSPKMKSETEAIQKIWGAFPSKIMRIAVRRLRWVHKAIRGCYGARPVSYCYTEDETLGGRNYEYKNLGFRYVTEFADA